MGVWHSSFDCYSPIPYLGGSFGQMSCPLTGSDRKESSALFRRTRTIDSSKLYHKLDQPFHLEMGGQIDQPQIAYHTYGKLNEDKSNVIVVCHALTANSNPDIWWNGLYGVGDIFDWDKYFIVCANNLGSPYGTSSAASIDPETGERFGMDFPFFTIRDTANLIIRLLEDLEIDQIKLMIGGSCGGNIAQEIAYQWTDQIENLVLLCCSPMESPWVIAIHESQRIALKSDPTLMEKHEEAGQAGLKACRAFALPFYRSHPSFRLRQTEMDPNKVDNFKASSYIEYQGQKFIDRFDAHCYYGLLNCLDTHNIGRDRESMENALSKITANTVVIGFDTDLLVPKVEQEFLAKHIPGGNYAEIETLFGHDAFLIEHEAIRNTIRKYINI